MSEENTREGVVLWFGVSPAPVLEVVCEVLLADVGLKRGQFGVFCRLVSDCLLLIRASWITSLPVT